MGADGQVTPARRRSPRRGQAGLSLVESILTVLLVSVVVLTLAAGMLTVIATSNATEEAQRLQSVLTSYTESLKAAPYLPCAVDPAAAATAYATAPGTWTPAPGEAVTVAVTRVEFWRPASVVGPGAGTFTAACPGVDGGAQRLSVSVTRNGRTATGQTVLRPLDPAP